MTNVDPFTMTLYADRIGIALQNNKKPRLSDLKKWWLSTSGHDLRQRRKFTIYIRYVKEESGFSVIAANLAGCASMGDTKEEARRNIKEAAHNIILACLDDCEPAPFTFCDALSCDEEIEVEVYI